VPAWCRCSPLPRLRVRTLWHVHQDPDSSLIPSTIGQFPYTSIFAGTSVAVLTYIGFDAISTFSEEVRNPRRNILLATVLVCLITGLLSGWKSTRAAHLGSKPFSSDNVESAFALVSAKPAAWCSSRSSISLCSSPTWFGMGSQLAAGRLLYGMGAAMRSPNHFSAPSNQTPCSRNNFWRWGICARRSRPARVLCQRLGGGAYEIGAQCLNFGAFIAFMASMPRPLSTTGGSSPAIQTPTDAI